MDRSDEFARIISVFTTPAEGEGGSGSNSALAGADRERPPPSLYVGLALNVSSFLDNNDSLVGKMKILADRKEFSNDPTAAMTEISGTFSSNVSRIQADLAKMKRLSDGGTFGEDRTQTGDGE